MTPDQQRIEFAKRLGWRVDYSSDKTHSDLSWYSADGVEFQNPIYADPTSHEDVYNAVLGMSEEEWKKFVRQFLTSFAWEENYSYDLVKACFCAPLSTLVECFMEATKGRIK